MAKAYRLLCATIAAQDLDEIIDYTSNRTGCSSESTGGTWGSSGFWMGVEIWKKR